ncbi:uncharacterized protein TRIADDRAFT_27037, partial [Trichoplax adhaerens]
GATAGALLTAPLEIIKTRLQASRVPHMQLAVSQPTVISLAGGNVTQALPFSQGKQGVVMHLRLIVQNEGLRALWKGIGPYLIGVAPARSVYFATYATSKKYFNSKLKPESSVVHMLSASIGGAVAVTSTCPIWVIKTRLQLDTKRTNFKSGLLCAKNIYATDGIRGFYRGLSASYVGIGETVLQFVIYERLKKTLKQNRDSFTQQKSYKDFTECIIAAAGSKFIASGLTYPHEVVRTRLREKFDGPRQYRSFVQTLLKVWREEGRPGLYGGMNAHLIRVIPNTVSMMLVYELVVYAISNRDITSY